MTNKCQSNKLDLKIGIFFIVRRIQITEHEYKLYIGAYMSHDTLDMYL